MLAINIDPRSSSLKQWTAFVTRFAPADLREITAAMAVQDVSERAIALHRLTALGTEIIVDREGRVTFRSDGPADPARRQAEIDKVL